MRIYNRNFRKKRVGKNLTTLLSVFLLQLSLASCGIGKDTNNTDTNQGASKETSVSTRPGFRAITGLVGTTDTGSSKGLGLVEETEASSCDVFCWLLDETKPEEGVTALTEGDEAPSQDSEVITTSTEGGDSQPSSSDPEAEANTQDVTGQAECYCNGETNEYYCDIPEGANFECGLAPQGIPSCTMNFAIAGNTTSVIEMGTAEDGSNGDVVHQKVNCVDGIAIVESEGDSFEKAVSPDFLTALKTGLPDEGTVTAISHDLGYDGHLISAFDQTRKDGEQGGCYTEHCGRKNDSQFALTDGHHAATGFEYGGDKENHNQKPPEAFHQGGQFFDNKIGEFNPIVCPKAGYSISDFYFQAAAGKNGGKDFKQSGAHFSFDFVKEEDCKVETATENSTCLINITVSVEGKNGEEETHTYENIPFTGVKNTFIMQGEENLSEDEIKERAIKEWGRNFLSQRQDFFIPMDLPYPDQSCEPINLVNRVRQHFGFDELKKETDVAYTPVFPNSYQPGVFHNNKEEGQLCSEIDEDLSEGVEASSLLTIKDLCTNNDQGDPNRFGKIRTQSELLTAYSDFFSTEEETTNDAITFVFPDTDRSGIHDNWDHLLENGCFDDKDSDDIENILDYYADDPNNNSLEDQAVIDLAYSKVNTDDWGHSYKWCLQSFQKHINDGLYTIADSYTTQEDGITHILHDKDEDKIPNMIDTCPDGNGAFKSKLLGEAGLTCVQNKASGYLKDVALLHADALCQAYDAKETRSFWNFKAKKEKGEGKTGWCRPHGDNAENLGTCSSAETSDACNVSGSCWWDNDYSFDESMTALKFVGLEMNASLWSDDWSMNELFDQGDEISFRWPDNIFQPGNWWSISVDEADEALADAQKVNEQWKDLELQQIHSEVSRCRDNFGGNKKDLAKRSTHISGILASVERLYELEKDGKKTRICTETETSFDAAKCLKEKDTYDIERGVECPQGKMTQCEFTNLQAVLLKAQKQITAWSNAQASIDAAYKYIEDAVETSSEKECLDDSLVHVSDAEEGTLTLAQTLSAFSSAYTTDLKIAQFKSFNHLRCMEMDKNLATAKESCMVAPSYGKKSAYSASVIDDLFLTEGTNEKCEGYINALGKCEEEIICPMPPSVDKSLRVQCIDDVINEARIAEGCGTDDIKEKFAFIGNLALQTSWNDGEPISKDDIVAKLIRMTSHKEGVDALLECKIEIKTPAYDENGCWIYEATLNEGTENEQTVLFSKLKETCYDENNALIEGCIARSDADVQSATWTRKTDTTMIDMRNIADREIIKMKLIKANDENEAKAVLQEEFDKLTDEAASEYDPAQ